MAMDIRDIFMVIRAKDQASRVITGLSRSASADFKRLQTAATLTAQRSAIDMQKVRQNYAQQILHQQKVLNGAIQQGNKTRASAAGQAIRDLRLMQQAEVLGIRQEQIMQKEIMLTARKHAEAKAAARTARVEAARSAGQWVAVGAGMAIAGAAGVKALHSMAMGSVEYQRQAALTMTQVHKQQTSVQELQDISTRVASSVGAPLERMQVALYDIFSSTDVSVKQSEVLLEAFAKAAVAGQVDIQQAGRATMAFMNAFKVPVKDVNKLLGLQFEAVRLGSMTYDEFSHNVGKAIPAVVNASQSMEFLAGTAAFLTRNGQTAAAAFVAIARGSEMFLRKPVQRNLREMGIEALTASGRLRPINELMVELAPHFAGLDDMARKRLFEKIFGGQNFAQARRFFDLAIKDSAELNRFINATQLDATEFGRAYAVMAETTAVKTEVLKNNWKIFKNELGTAAVPALNTLLEVGIKTLKWLNDLSPTQKKVIASTIALASVVIALSGVLIALAGTVKIVAAGIGILRLSAEGATTALGARGLLGVLSRVSLVLGGVITLWQAGEAAHSKYINKLVGSGSELDKAKERLAGMQAEMKKLSEDGGPAAIENLAALQFAARNLEIDIAKAEGRIMSANVELTKSREVYYAAASSSIAAANAAGGYGASIKAAAGEVDKNTGALGKNKQAVDKVTEAVKLSIPQFRGVETQVKKTATEVNKQLEKEIQAYTNWSKNIQTLIRRGVDPRFIQMLSKRGPEYVAAYANGSKAQLQRGVTAWQQLHGAMVTASQQKLGKEAPKGSVEYRRKHAEQVEAARRKHAEKMAAMERQTRINMIKAGEQVSGFRRKANTEMGNLKGATRTITFKSTFTPPKDFSMHSIVGATGGYVTDRGIFPALRRAAGGIIDRGSGPTADDVLARLSRGEYVVNARATSKHRDLLEQINREGLPGYATGGMVDYNVRFPDMDKFSRRIQNAINIIGQRVETGIERNFKLFVGAGREDIKRFIRSVDPLPYKWGAAGPGSYDCSGLVSAVHGMVRGLSGAGRGLRLYTTSTIRSGIQGLKPGLGGVLQIGVTAGTGHMAGRYGGLGFEAESSRTGIKIGSAASRPESFARRFHLARGGYINWRDAGAIAELASMPGVDIGGDADKLRLMFRGKNLGVFQNGAWRTREGLGYIHNDEMILPKRIADPVRAGTASAGRGVVMYNTFNNNANPQQVAQQLGWELSSRI